MRGKRRRGALKPETMCHFQVSGFRCQLRSDECRVDKLKGTKEYGDAVRDSALHTMVATKDLVFQPVKTRTEVGSGIGVAFRRAGGSLFGAKRSDAEDSKFKDLIGFSTYKREYAHELGVDVYSRNEVLQERLNEISWAGFAGGLTVSAAMAAVPGGAGIAMTVISTTRLTTEIFKNTPPPDLRRANTEKLKAMGIDPTTTDMFISDSVFSPREQTLLVSALDEMKGVADRERFVQLAALTTMMIWPISVNARQRCTPATIRRWRPLRGSSRSGSYPLRAHRMAHWSLTSPWTISSGLHL